PRARSRELRQRPAAGEPVRELVPELDVALAQAPAEPDLTAARQRREVDQAGLDLAQGDPQLVDPDDTRLHPVDHALHPETEDADVGVGAGLRGSVAAALRAGIRGVVGGRDHLVAEPDELGALVAQRLEDRPDLRDRLVRLVEVIEPGHPTILAR